MADRRAELEAKKAKLQSMRESRSELTKAKVQLPNAGDSSNALSAAARTADADDVLKSLGIEGLPRTNSGIEMRVPNSMQSSALSGVEAFMTPSQSFMIEKQPGSDAGSARRRPQLSVGPIKTETIQPKESITYSKEVQTLPTTPNSNEVASLGVSDGVGRAAKSSFDYYVFSRDEALTGGSRISSPKLFFSAYEWEDEFASIATSPQPHHSDGTVLAYDGEDDDMPSHHHHGTSPSEYDVGLVPGQNGHQHVPTGVIARLDSDAKPNGPAISPQPTLPLRPLTEEELLEINQSERFLSSVLRCGRVIERALTLPDVCMDYTRDMSSGKATAGSNEIINLSTTFTDERHGSRHRLVTAVDFSPLNPELVLASYCDHSDSGVADPQGLVLIWNTKFPGAAPEFVFHAESPVRAACFAPFHPNLVVGATYSGQVVLWDTRLPRKTPANRTPLTSSAHTHPIYCLKVVGTQNANNLISISTDGRLCSWTLDMFSAPQETLDLVYKQKPVNAVCCSFLDNDPNNFVVGSEDGALYTACRHGNKQGVLDQFDYGHQFNLTAVDTHHARGPVDFSNLVLTASNDWTVRLWSTRHPKMYIEQFREGQDSITDVRWSPMHPALFASSDASGRLYLYDLNQNCEVPIAQVNVESGRSLIKRVSWHPSGLYIAAGTESGLLHLYNVNETTAIPRPDDWQLFNSSVRMMMASAEDRLHQTPMGQVPASLLSSIPSGPTTTAPSSLGVSSPAVQAAIISSAASTASNHSTSSTISGSVAPMLAGAAQ